MISTRLTEALNDVYAAFATQQKPTGIAGCPCCVDSTEACHLLSTPLRDITAEQLSGYASAVFLGVGDVTDFRYFLPRVLDISLNTPYWWPDREVVLGKLFLANWNTWSETEVESLLHLFNVGFDEALFQNDDPAWELDSWICGLVLAGVEIGPFLRRLQESSKHEVIRELFELNAPALREGKLRNAHYDARPSAAEPLVAWYRSPDVQTVLAGKHGRGDG